jgi:hypothetical protein
LKNKEVVGHSFVLVLLQSESLSLDSAHTLSLLSCSITMKFVLYNGYLRKFTYAFLTLKFLKTGRFAE